MREEKYTDMSLTDEQASLLGFKSLSMPEQYIQVKDVYYSLDEFNRIGELLLGRNLTDDQQVVLEWLKQYMLDDSDFKNTICELSKLYIAGVPYTKEEIAFKKLSDSELAQVLAAFASYGLEDNQ